MQALIIAKNSPSWVSYQVSIGIIFLEKKAIRRHRPKSFKSGLTENFTNNIA